MAIRSYQGRLPVCGERVFVDEMGLVIGDVKIGEDSSVWPMVVIRGDVNRIRIGKRSNVQDGTVVHVTHPHAELPEGHGVFIGDEVTIGHNTTIHGCTIEDQCLIGIGATVLDGAIIRSQVLLGAGSLVSEGKELEGGYLWLGTPAKRVRPLTEEERNWFRYSANHYVKLKNNYLQA